MTQPIFLGGLIRYFSPGSDMNRDTAYLYAAGVVVCSTFIVLIENPVWLAALHTGMKMRVGTCSLIYRKVNLSATNLEIDFCISIFIYFYFSVSDFMSLVCIMVHLINYWSDILLLSDSGEKIRIL